MQLILAQQNYHIGNLAYNTDKIIVAIQQAIKKRADLIVFPELSLCGYPPHDDFFTNNYFKKIDTQINIIRAACKGITAIIGTPRLGQNDCIYNSALVISNTKIIATIDKTLLPEYDVFNERRYFTPATQWTILKIQDQTIAVTICEDIWFDKNKYATHPLKQITASQKINGIINISASPYDSEHLEERIIVARKNAISFQVPVYYVNTVGAQSDLIFDGNSFVINKKGELVQQAKSFEEDLLFVDSEDISSMPKLSIPILKPTKNIIEKMSDPIAISNIYKALVLGIRDYCHKTGFQKIILGASGGIDSAVVQALAIAALGKDNVVALLMPSKFSSIHSQRDAKDLSKNLGNEFYVVPIKNEYDAFLASLKPLFKNNTFSVAEENMQSRIRGNMLMTMANKHNYLLLNTSNKSELAMGYGTLYGDMAGALSILGDLFKTQVIALAKHINKDQEIIPNNVFIKAPSAELRPNQKDTDTLPEYNVLDNVLYSLIHEKESITDLLKRQSVDKNILTNIFKQYALNEYKRHQFCPILRVSNKSFGRGRKIEVVSKLV